MKSLSSSRREVLVDCFHVYTYYISYLLPGCARTQHPAAPLHHFFSHYPAAAADSPRHVRSTEEIRRVLIYIGLPKLVHPKWVRLGITSLEEYARHFNCVTR